MLLREAAMILLAILSALVTWRLCRWAYVVRPRQAALREVSHVIMADLLVEGEKLRKRAVRPSVLRDLQEYRRRREGPGAA